MDDCTSSGGRVTAPPTCPDRPDALACAASALERWRCASLARRELAMPDDRQLAALGLHRAELQCTVPIRSIAAAQRDCVMWHLLALDAADRYLRFAYAATDEQLQRYVEQIDFGRDKVFGIFNRRLEPLAFAHLAPAGIEGVEHCAEFGVSVDRRARRRGWGTRLLERAVTHARNAGVELLLLRAFSENTAALRLARRAGAVVQARGAESEGWLRLPGATPDSRRDEMVCDAFAETDYRLKEQAARSQPLAQCGGDARGGAWTH